MGRCGENFEFVLDKNAGFTNKNFGNLAFYENFDFIKTFENRKQLAKILNLNVKNLIFMNQMHGCEIVNVDEIFLNKFHENFDNFINNFDFKKTSSEILKQKFNKICPKCDAFISNLNEISLCVMVADCSPILVKNEGNFAAIHAGRKGIEKKILTKTILQMEKIFNTKRDKFEIFIGPNIKQNCYEIGDLKMPNFEKFIKNKKFSQDLALKDEIEKLNISNYYFSDVCTKCDDNFFSYRKDKNCGRFAGFIKK